eukprot:gb/GECG01016277.1/.p1 GENE.gb/GECG01016277.1/~~gb/GECG01016277.1/.p1  ORF type:complete len:242 (+),score=36.05 gb/GECG01016277.1/:1-726(+)
MPRHLRITEMRNAVRALPRIGRSSVATSGYADVGVSTLHAFSASPNSSYVHQFQRHAHNRAPMTPLSSSSGGQLSSTSSALSPGRTFHTDTSLTQESVTAAHEEQSVEVVQPSATHEDSLKISDRCVERLEEIAAKEKYRDLVERGEFKLRVGVRAGGCDGFEYFLDLDKEPAKEDDIIFQRGIAKIVVDDQALEKIEGSTIDFTEDLIGSKFAVVDNPNAETSCGCGTSFAPKEEEGFKI